MNDDPTKTAEVAVDGPDPTDYMRGWRNGMKFAADLLNMSDQTGRLAPSALTVMERRLVVAVLRWKMDEINRAADDGWKRIMGDVL